MSDPLLDAGRPVARDPRRRFAGSQRGLPPSRRARGAEEAHVEPRERRPLPGVVSRWALPGLRRVQVRIRLRHPGPGAPAGSPAEGSPTACRRAGGGGGIRGPGVGRGRPEPRVPPGLPLSPPAARGAGERADRAGRAAGRLSGGLPRAGSARLHPRDHRARRLEAGGGPPAHGVPRLVAPRPEPAVLARRDANGVPVRPVVANRRDPRRQSGRVEPRPADRRSGTTAGQSPVVARRPPDRLRFAEGGRDVRRLRDRRHRGASTPTHPGRVQRAPTELVQGRPMDLLRLRPDRPLRGVASPGGRRRRRAGDRPGGLHLLRVVRRADAVLRQGAGPPAARLRAPDRRRPGEAGRRRDPRPILRGGRGRPLLLRAHRRLGRCGPAVPRP